MTSSSLRHCCDRPSDSASEGKSFSASFSAREYSRSMSRSGRWASLDLDGGGKTRHLQWQFFGDKASLLVNDMQK